MICSGKENLTNCLLLLRCNDLENSKMKITHYLYNAFVIEDGKKKVAIDPGQNLWIFKKNSLIPETEWNGITDILVTHGDPDHFVYAITMAKQTAASVVCGKGLEADFVSEKINHINILNADDSIELDGLKVEGIKTRHGPLPVKILGGLFYVRADVVERDVGGQQVFLAGIQVQKKENPLLVYSHGTVKLLFGLLRLEKDNVDFARGSIGFKITINGKTIINLGDSLLLNDWEDLQTDILMLPIGGSKVPNTMNVENALEAVRMISPKIVIPCHYNIPYAFIRNVNPTDVNDFKKRVEKMGVECKIMSYGDEIHV